MWRILWLIWAVAGGYRLEEPGQNASSLRNEGRVLMMSLPYRHLVTTLSNVHDNGGVFRIISTSMLPSKQYKYHAFGKPHVSLLFDAKACEILVATWDMNDLMMGGGRQGKPKPWASEDDAKAWWSEQYPLANTKNIDKYDAGMLDLSSVGWQPEWWESLPPNERISEPRRTSEEVRAELHSTLKGAYLKELEVNEVMANCPVDGLLGVGLSRDDVAQTTQVRTALVDAGYPLDVMMVEMCNQVVAWDVDNPAVSCKR